MVIKDTSAVAILTRPQGKNETLAKRLDESGIGTLIMPALSIEPVACDPALLPLPARFDLVVFVSGMAARLYFQQLAQAGGGEAWPVCTYAATVGRASADVLYQNPSVASSCILHPTIDAASHDSESLWTVLEPHLPTIRRVLIVRGQTGREWLGQQFERAGVSVHRYCVYRREPQCWTAAQADSLKGRLARSHTAVCLVTSSESADAIHANVQRHQVGKLWERARFVTIHQRVASRLQFWFATASGNLPAPYIQVCAPDDATIFRAIHLAVS